MKQICHLSEIADGKFYLCYKPVTTGYVPNFFTGAPRGKRFNIIECFNEGDKEIKGDIPTGIIRTEIRVLVNISRGTGNVYTVDIVDTKSNVYTFSPIYPEPDELIFELDREEVAIHVYMEAM